MSKFFEYLERRNRKEELKLITLIHILDKFENDKVRYSDLIKDNVVNATNLFYRAMNKIYELNPQKIIFSLTKTDSIYFRVYCDFNKIIHLEVFYIKDNEQDDIEAVTTIYEGNEVILKNYGKLVYVFEEITEVIDKVKSSDEQIKFISGDSLGGKFERFGPYIVRPSRKGLGFRETISLFKNKQKESTFADATPALSC